MLRAETAGSAFVRSGKVRDLYRIDDERLLLVASDRISAFDVVLPTPVPDKGRVLTGLSRFWFAETADIVRTHLVGTAPGGANGTFFLKNTGAGKTVFDDNAVDTVDTAAGGNNFMFLHTIGSNKDVILGSAGTNDFNHEEMIQLNRGLKTPHRLEIFEGTHEWLPVELATDGVEWMEIQAMKKGQRPPAEKIVDEVFAQRIARAEAQKSALDQMRELRSIAADFEGLKDVSAIAKRAAALESTPEVKKEMADVR